MYSNWSVAAENGESAFLLLWRRPLIIPLQLEEPEDEMSSLEAIVVWAKDISNYSAWEIIGNLRHP